MSGPRLALLASLLLTAGIYWPGLAGPLVFDDAQNLAPLNDWLQGRTSWLAVVLGNNSGLFGRPVSMASFVLNVQLFGPEVWAFKFVNLLIHLLCGALVFAFFTQLTKCDALARHQRPILKWLPWFGASLWLLHPLNASTVLYVIQRMAMLSTLFTLLVLLAYLRGRSLLATQPRRALIYLLLGMPAFTLLAILSKENGLLAPALCALLELFVFQPKPETRRAWQAWAFILLVLVLPCLIALGMTLAQAPIIVEGYANRPFTLTERLLTEFRVLWDYLGALMIPGGARLGLYHDDYPVSTGLLSPAGTVLAMIAWFATVVMAWKARRDVPGFSLGVGFFLIGHTLESSVFPLLIYFEHRNYLPAIGALWALLSLVAHAMQKLQSRMPRANNLIAVSACLLVAVLGVGTLARAYAWSDRDTLLHQSLIHHPDSRWLRMDLIMNAMDKNPPRLEEARLHADHLLGMNDPLARRFGAIERVLIDCASGIQPPARLIDEMFAGQETIIEADLLLAFDNLSDSIVRQPCQGLTPLQMADRLARMLDQAALPPGTLGVWRLRYRAANLFLAAGLLERAIEQARLAVAGGTAQVQARIFLAGLLIKNGDVQAATRELDTASAELAEGETLGREIIKQYRSQLQQNTL